MQLSTPVALPTAPFQLDPDRHVLTLGSCFAQHIGQHIADALPAGHALVNPFGPLYAPRVIAHHLGVLLDTQPLPDATYFEGREGLWHNRWFSTHVSAGDAATCRAHTAAALMQARESLRRADVLVLTLGTDRHYRLHDGRLVANCHKQPSADFTEQADTVDDLTTLLLESVEQLRTQRPDLHIVWTVSPYRYAKYGLHASQLSKARLLLAVDAVCAADERSVYFPAYEIVLDELRDYRFYARDLLHPSDTTVEFIAERFADWCFSPALCRFAAERARLMRAQNHHPLHPESDEHRAFRAKLREEVELFTEKWGFSPF